MLPELLFLAFIIFLVIGIAIHQDRPLLEHTVSHWYQTIDGLTATPGEFYEAVQARLREQNFPGIVTKVVSFREGGILSARLCPIERVHVKTEQSQLFTGLV